MKYSKNTVKWMAAAAFAGVAFSAQAALIGSETFGGYANGSLGGANEFVATDNVGFGAYGWKNATGFVGVQTGTSLTHNGLSGAKSGSLLVGTYAGGVRSSNRGMTASIPSSGSYYMSGLLNLAFDARLSAGQRAEAGFTSANPQYSYDISQGMHLGMRKDGTVNRLIVSAGGTSWDIGTALQSTTYQIVLQLDVNAGSADTLSAWYAKDGDTSLTQGLAATSVETWDATGDLSRLLFQANPNGEAHTGLNFDEVRLGTTLADVTTIPEPATLGLIGLAAGGIFMMRRLSM